MSHAELVEVAGRWLVGTRKCGVVLLERRMGEIPDAIGWVANTCVLVECKTSRADFLRDAKKVYRQPDAVAFGSERWYLTPPGLLAPDELPAQWGLLEYTGRLVRKRKLPLLFRRSEVAIHRELRLVLSELNCYHAQGIGYKTITGRWVVPPRFKVANAASQEGTEPK